jgi:hypothetical protein
MEADRQTINIQPELTLLDRSDMDSIGLFNRFVLDNSDVVQSVIRTDDVIKVAPPARVAPEAPASEQGRSTQQRNKVTDAIRGLLTAAHNGRHIDYDNGTWGDLMQDPAYIKEVRKLQTMDRRDNGVEEQRRRVAVTGLGIYATRVISYETQPAELAARDAEDFIKEAERIPLIVEPMEVIPEPGLA